MAAGFRICGRFLWSLFWGLSLLLGGPAVQAQTEGTSELHLSAEQLSTEPDLIWAQGQVRAFWAQDYLLAGSLVWSPQRHFLTAQGAVELGTPAWKLRADRLDLDTERTFIWGQRAQLDYRDLQLAAGEVRLQSQFWQFFDVRLRLPDTPWQLHVDQVQILPGQAYENLILEGVALPVPGWKWPRLVLTLPGLTPDRTEIRPPLNLLQPELAWQGQNLVWGFSSQLWNSETQRLYWRLRSDPDTAWFSEISHEWRPDPDWLVNTQVQLQPQAVRGSVESLWHSPWGPWLRAQARWLEPDDFARSFWLPQPAAVPERRSDLDFWLTSPWQNWQSLSFRYLLGARWPQTEAGFSLLGQWPFAHWGRQTFWVSTLLNLQVSGEAEPALQSTDALRLLDQWQILPELELGGYLEQYLSTHPAAYFLSPERLSPWLGSYLLWQARSDLGLGLELSLNPFSGHLTRADALLTWKVRPFYLHLLLQGIPTGVQVNVNFSLN